MLRRRHRAHLRLQSSGHYVDLRAHLVPRPDDRHGIHLPTEQLLLEFPLPRRRQVLRGAHSGLQMPGARSDALQRLRDHLGGVVVGEREKGLHDLQAAEDALLAV